MILAGLIIVGLIGFRYLIWILLKTAGCQGRIAPADEIGFVLHDYETAYFLHFDIFWIRLWRHEERERDCEDAHSWGLECCSGPIQAWYLKWGKARLFIEYPWAWQFDHWEHMMPDGRWVDCNSQESFEGKFVFSTPYIYTLKDGTTQVRIATVHVDRIHRKRKWLPWCKYHTTSIDVRFDAEVGERTGSWKGGVMGCGYMMLQGESPLECLIRMERERIFD